MRRGNGDGTGHVTENFGKTRALPLYFSGNSQETGGCELVGPSWFGCACGFLVSFLFWEMADLEGIHHFFSFFFLF